MAPGSEAALAALFGALTVATTLNINGAELFNAALLAAQWDQTLVQEAVPGAAAFLAILGALLRRRRRRPLLLRLPLTLAERLQP